MFANRARLAQWLQGRGIEIGALHQPLRVPADAHVTYVDHLPLDQLREHYPELAELPLTTVDVIGTAEDLSAFADASLDFVIANHLVEHLEYPVQALGEFERVLRPGGILYLALPDKRRTFDHERELTTVEHLVDEQRDQSAEANRRQHFLEWAQHVDEKAPGDETEAHADDLMARSYSIHFHVWRPDTFLDFLSAARREFGLRLETLQFASEEEADDFEFILLLAKPTGDTPVLPPQREAARPLEIGDLITPGPSSLRQFVLSTPLGPPLRAARRRIRG